MKLNTYDTNTRFSDEDILINFTKSNNTYRLKPDGNLEIIDNKIDDKSNPIVDINEEFIIRKNGDVSYSSILNTNGFIKFDSNYCGEEKTNIGKILKIQDNIILDDQGKIYYYNYSNNMMNNILIDKKIKDIYTDYYDFAKDSDDNMYYLAYDAIVPIEQLKGKKIKNAITDFDVLEKVYKEYVLTEDGKVYEFQINDKDDGTYEVINFKCIVGSESSDESLKNVQINLIYEGYECIYAIDTNGKLYSWGDNEYGQLGNNTKDNIYVPQCINNISSELKNVKFKRIENFYTDVYAIDENNNIYAWGENRHGRLGTDGACLIPTKIIENIDIVKMIDIDYECRVILDKNGKVYVAGSNAYGILGNPELERSNTYICLTDNAVFKDKKIEDIESINDLSLLLKDEDGNFYVSGGTIFSVNQDYIKTPISLNINPTDALYGIKIAEIIDEIDMIIDTDGKLYTYAYDSENKKYKIVCETENKESIFYNKYIKKYNYKLGYGSQSVNFLTKDNELIINREERLK